MKYTEQLGECVSFLDTFAEDLHETESSDEAEIWLLQRAFFFGLSCLKSIDTIGDSGPDNYVCAPLIARPFFELATRLFWASSAEKGWLRMRLYWAREGEKYNRAVVQHGWGGGVREKDRLRKLERILSDARSDPGSPEPPPSIEVMLIENMNKMAESVEMGPDPDDVGRNKYISYYRDLSYCVHGHIIEISGDQAYRLALSILAVIDATRSLCLATIYTLPESNKNPHSDVHNLTVLMDRVVRGMRIDRETA